MSDDELTPSEKQAMETLPRERMPRAALEERVVKALRSQGVLYGNKRRVVELTAARIAGVVAASLVLVVGGFTLGQWVNDRQPGRTDFAVGETFDISAAASLQQAGAAYIAALENLAALPDSTHARELQQGREVALNTLYGAAGQVTKIVPKEYLASQFVQALEVANHAQRGQYKQPRLIWF